MTFDLFADPAPAAAERDPNMDGMLPQPAADDPYPMKPAGQPNRWTYRGELITYAARRAVPSKVGKWATIEGIGQPILHSDDRAELCRAIDARLGGAQ